MAKFLLKIWLIIPLLYILQLNYSLYYSPTFKTIEGAIYNESVYHQLQFLKDAINKEAANEMQALYPEGFVFLHAIYALSWKDFLQSIPKQSAMFTEGIGEMDKALTQIYSERGKAIFDEDLPIVYGAFYTGWSNYVLGSKLEVETPNQQNQQDIALFKAYCEQMAKVIASSDYPYFESYRNQSWPGDNFLVIASLALHDRMFAPKYTTLITEWMSKVKNHLDRDSGLIPHSVDTHMKRTIEGARGSSQSLTLNFLYEIDVDFATDQFEQFKQQFLDTRLGLWGIREYPKGKTGSGDVDSGPVIWDIGGAASIVGQRTLWKFGNQEMAKAIRNNLEAFGLTFTWNAQKRYLFGQLPMADAFMAWSNAVEITPTNSKPNDSKAIIHLLSLFILVMSLYFLKI